MKVSLLYPKIVLCLLLLFFSGCTKLKRDNPLDINNTSANAASGPEVKFSRYEVYQDSNNDKQINKGELIKLKVYLVNKGGSVASKVRGTISCSNNYISDLYPPSEVGYSSAGIDDYIAPGSEGNVLFVTSYLSFSVYQTTPSGSVINFQLTITDASNNTWSDTFTITVL